MRFVDIFLVVYAITTLVAVTMTYREQKRRHHHTPLYTLLGYALCTVWPLVAALIVLIYRPWQAEGPGAPLAEAGTRTRIRRE